MPAGEKEDWQAGTATRRFGSDYADGEEKAVGRRWDC